METVICQMYDTEEFPNFRNSGIDCLHLWCLNRDSYPVRLRIENFSYFAHIELPSFVNGRVIKWDVSKSQLLVDEIASMLKKDAPIGWELCSKKKLYYDRGNREYSMLKLHFNAYTALKHCENLVVKSRKYGCLGEMVLPVWESGIKNIRKLFTKQNCKFSQWFSVKGVIIPIDHEDRLSTPGTEERPILEYIIDYNTITPIDF
jgi:hypothetical protein